MEKAVFTRFCHDHHFEFKAGATIMTDRIDSTTPFVVLGRIADLIFLRRYMARLLERRATAIQAAAEARAGHLTA